MIKSLIYKYLYKSSGNQVMGALTNSYAYEIYKKTNEAKILKKEERNKRIQRNMQELENSINYNIRTEMSDGKYKAKTECYNVKLTKEQKQYLKDLYENQGFKISFGYKKREDHFKLINTIKVSWKHYKTA
jgi:hypothetical protein